MGKFTLTQKRFFNAKMGAGSIVTEDEASNSQITLVKDEVEVLHTIIPPVSITREGVNKNPKAKKVTFYNLSSQSSVDLNLNLPKPDPKKKETRIYLSKVAGFKPTMGEYWFLFVDANTDKLVIGNVDEATWIASGGTTDPKYTSITRPIKSALPIVDEDDQKYQVDVNNTDPLASKSVIYKKENRSSSVKETSLRQAKYQCEIDSSHTTFSATTGNPYVEAHHLVPLSQTTLLGINLDLVENIVCLCPNCHCAVHYAEKSERLDYLSKLYTLRVAILKSKGISVTMVDLARMYNCL